MKFKYTPVALALFAAVSTPYAFAADEVAQSEEESVERIVVTGSKIARPGVESAAAVVSIDASDLAITGNMNIAETLATLPQFAMGIDSTGSAYTPGDVGLSTVNLRSLGTHRTLVLINGRRPTQTADSSGRLVTDLQNIPASLIDHIEVLTGGASAVYGSDALAGVVNVILKKDFEGLDINAQASSTEEKDGETQAFSLSYGNNFNEGKGNFVVSVDYINQEEMTWKSRPGSQAQSTYVNNPNDSGPDEVVLNNVGWADYNIESDRPTFYNYNSGEYVQFNRNEDGSLGEGYIAITDAELFDYYKQSYDNNPNMYSSVADKQPVQPYDRINVNLHGGYELDDDVYFTANLSYSKVDSEITLDPDYIYSWNGRVNIYDAPFDIPAEVVAAAESIGTENIRIPYTFNDFGARKVEVDREYVSAAFGLEGDLENGWAWDAYLSLGQTSADQTHINSAYTARYDDFELVGACEENNSCAEFNPFMPMAQETIDYLRLDPHTDTTETFQYTVAAGLSGDIMTLPAGDLMFSTGLDLREEGLKTTPSQASLEGLSHGSTLAPIDVDRSIQEAYIELVAPLVEDVMLVKSLEFETAYRYANYTYAGGNDSWKFGLNWAVDDNVRLRTIYSKAVRAPQLTELFRAESVGESRFMDPCDVDELDNGVGTDPDLRAANCAALGLPADFEAATRITGGVQRTIKGNENLDVETAHTLTAGVVFTPVFIDNFTLSLDYYDIDLEDGISQFGAEDTTTNCVDSSSINNTFCPEVTRGADGNITNVNDTYVNANQMRRRGLDIESYYLQELGEFGEIDLNLYVTHIFESSFADSELDSSDREEYVGVNGTPDWKGTLNIGYTFNDLRVTWQTNYSSSVLYKRDATADDYSEFELPASTLHNLRVSYDVNDQTNVYVGISNVADKDWLGTPGTSSGGSTYPISGRGYYAGVNLSF
jgi:outer membrane receptor protein involved in Fe transport